MKLPARPSGGGLKFSLTPMIDVIFNLIIFFIAASHMARSGEADPVDLSAAGTAHADELQPPGRLTLTISAEGEYRISGRPRDRAEIESWLEENAKLQGPDQVELVLRVDRRTLYGAVSPLLRRCADLGITQVRFATQPGPKP